MADTTLVNFRLDRTPSARWRGVCRDLGMSMTTAFTLFAKKVNRERRIPFDVSLDGAGGSTGVRAVARRGRQPRRPAVIVEGVTARLWRGGGRAPRARRRLAHGAPRGVRRRHGGLGIGQVHAPAHLGWRRRAHFGSRRGRWHGPLHLGAGCAGRSSAGTPSGSSTRRTTSFRSSRRATTSSCPCASTSQARPLRGGGAARPSRHSRLRAESPLRAVGRAAAARRHRPALAAKPAVVLADEPTGSLDRANGGAWWQAARQGARPLGTTVVLVTHDERRRRRGGPRCAHLGRPRR